MDIAREYVLLGEAARRIAEGKTLVSTTFVVPYPPGFPVLVPGQMISKEILYFLAQRFVVQGLAAGAVKG